MSSIVRNFVLAVAVGLLVGLIIFTNVARATPGTEQDPHKVYVCKYVGTPGVDERLQTGQNPIEVDSHALEGDGFDGTFPFEFSDAQGRSVAIGWSGEGYPVLTIEDCPAPVEPSPTPSPSPSPTEPPEPTEPPSPGGDWTPGWTPSDDAPPVGTSPRTDLAETGISGGVIVGGVAFLIAGLGALTLARKWTKV